jgi:hypothetical protein
LDNPWSKVRALLIEGVHVVLENLEIDLGKCISFGSQT